MIPSIVIFKLAVSLWNKDGGLTVAAEWPVPSILDRIDLCKGKAYRVTA